MLATTETQRLSRPGQLGKCQHPDSVQEVEKVKQLLGLEDIEPIFSRRPLLLNSSEIEETLQELHASLEQHGASGDDARTMLLEMPALIYSNKRAHALAVRPQPALA